MTYRRDIDGLRAVAVLPVVFYHAGIPGVGGGFVGVDIFFVISGYLITTIINETLNDGSFSLLDFYERRVRRIFPALIAVISVTSVVISFVYLPDDVDNFGRSAASTALFSSNFFFFPKSSYFAKASEFKPLLHTWSLAVEEQFYLFHPLILMLVHRWAPRRLVAVLIGIAALSLLASAILLHRSANAVFYLAPFRAWELFAGAIVAAATGPRPLGALWRTLIGTAGLALIAVAVFRYDAAMAFPGPAALVPCGGAAALLYAGQKGSNWANSLLETPVLRFFGLISYSLYLWHWPIIVIYRYYIFPASSASSAPSLVLASIVAGTLSWRFIERPFREPSLVRTRAAAFKIAAAATTAVLLLGSSMALTHGWPGRFPALEAKIAAFSGGFNPNRSQCTATDVALDPIPARCIYGEKAAAPTYAIWGDSHGAELAVALGDLVATKSASIVQMTQTQCPPALHFFLAIRPRCPAQNDTALDFLLKKPEIDRVVLVAHYHIYGGDGQIEAFKAGFSQVISRLVAAGKKLYIVYPVPESSAPIPYVAALYVMQHRDPETNTISRESYEATNSEMIAFLDSLRDPNITKIDPTDALCDAISCKTMQRGQILYYDADHLNVHGARYIAHLFDPLLAAAASGLAP